jgi:DNA mismatch repair protein MSH3
MVKRYRTPRMAELTEERARAMEKLEAEANKAYSSFLTDIIDNYGPRLRDAINRLAVVDCLQSFAAVAREQQTYVRPKLTEDDTLEIVGGRHPIVETLLERPCIANSIRFGGHGPGHEPCKIITGPNMGGKSSTTKMIALIAIMAQVGSFVPAEAVTMGMLDGIMTRMGGKLWGRCLSFRRTFTPAQPRTNWPGVVQHLWLRWSRQA